MTNFMLYLESLNKSLHNILRKNQDVIFIGEDLLDPYGGAFKVSKGLSTNFPKQVISTPISEAGIVGADITCFGKFVDKPLLTLNAPP
jgi:pyruvate/2-oxoglutarate/acetoin dehydrogenase E1 component